MRKRIVIDTNKKYGRLKPVKHIEMRNKRNIWLWLCDCGNTKEIAIYDVLDGHTQSCGCFRKENNGNEKHGMCYTRFYNIYKKAEQRCNNKSDISYYNYGGRGIKFEWTSFDQFKADMYESYLQHVKDYGERKTTIDRINNDGNYSKDNCRWATQKEQCLNTRFNKRLTYKGITKTLKEWGDSTGLGIKTIWYRKNAGWSIENIMDTSTDFQKLATDKQKGEGNGNSRLTEKQVEEILKDNTNSMRGLAKIYKVNHKLIMNIKRGLAWKHVYDRVIMNSIKQMSNKEQSHVV